MLNKLRAMLFNAPIKKKMPPVREKSKCLVNLELAGRMHTFYQDASFAESLTKAMAVQMPTTVEGEFLEFKNSKGNGYAINLRFIKYMEISDDVYEIDNDDAPGYSIYLQGKNDPIELGKLSVEQVDINLSDRGIQFVRLGNHYFKRDEVALICSLN